MKLLKNGNEVATVEMVEGALKLETEDAAIRKFYEEGEVLLPAEGDIPEGFEGVAHMVPAKEATLDQFVMGLVEEGLVDLPESEEQSGGE